VPARGSDEVSVVDGRSSVSEPKFGGPNRPLFGASPTTRVQVADDPDRPLAGRLAVITGGAGLLGSAMAAELGARGADVCLMGHDADELRRTMVTLGDDVQSLMLRCDLATESEVRSAVEFVERMDRPVDVLVHAAGVQAPATIAAGTVEALDEHYLLNVRGPYLLTQRLLGPLTEASGQVVFFTVSESEPGTGGDAHHHISQAGMQAFASELRTEAARLGIRVLTVDAVARTWGDVSLAAEGPGGQSLLRSLASSVVNTLTTPGIDVTELRVQPPSGATRRERR
jgi:NAD(P)-dependent dehydrogenase (short-subunit alcohol dehydrogenase family)